MGTLISRDALLAKASSYVGMMERTNRNDIWFADDWGITGYAWCFAFVQSCFYYAGAPLPLVSMYCPTGVQYARDNGQAIEVGQDWPLPGDIVFFSWDMAAWPRNRAGVGDHVGIVESYGGGDSIDTIEGNIGSPGGVYRKTRSISGTVVCFWRPPVFTDGGGSFGVAAVQTTPTATATPQPAPPEDDDVRYSITDTDGTLYFVVNLDAYPLTSYAKSVHDATGLSAEFPPRPISATNPAPLIIDKGSIAIAYRMHPQDDGVTLASVQAGVNNSYANLSATLNGLIGKLGPLADAIATSVVAKVGTTGTGGVAPIDVAAVREAVREELGELVLKAAS